MKQTKKPKHDLFFLIIALFYFALAIFHFQETASFFVGVLLFLLGVVMFFKDYLKINFKLLFQKYYHEIILFICLILGLYFFIKGILECQK